MDSPHFCPKAYDIFEGNWSQEKKTGTCTGKCWFCSPDLSGERQSERLLDPTTVNCLDPMLLTSTYGKRKLESPERNSNWGRNQLNETVQETGKQYEILHDKDDLTTSKLSCIFVITGVSKPLLVTIYRQLVESGKCTFIGEAQVLVSLDVLGMKQDYRLILRTPAPSFGTVTEVRSTLWWMNFEEQLTLDTFCDGAIGIRSSWKLKDPVQSLWLKKFGSHLT